MFFLPNNFKLHIPRKEKKLYPEPRHGFVRRKDDHVERLYRWKFKYEAATERVAVGFGIAQFPAGSDTRDTSEPPSDAAIRCDIIQKRDCLQSMSVTEEQVRPEDTSLHTV